MNKFNGDVTWNHNLNETPYNSRTSLYHKITNYLDDINNICDYEFDVIERIGSESQYGEVFLIHSKTNEKLSFVVKLLPIINKNSLETNENEINIAIQASQLVLEGQSKHFLIIYDSKLCSETIFYNSKLTTKSKKYQNNNLKSYLLISELALCDLKQYLSIKVIDETEWIYIIKECTSAIHDMHSKLGVCHNDLHLGNFLILKNEKKNQDYNYNMLIHDFGKADFREVYQELDIKFFIECLLEVQYIPIKIKTYLLSLNY